MSPEQTVSPLSQFIPLLLIFLIFYFLIIKPQQKQQKEQEEMRKTLKKNDRVVTAGGIHGTVVNLKDTTVVLRLDDNVKVEFDRESIARRVKARDEKKS